MSRVIPLAPQSKNDTLLSQAFDITMLGVILTVLNAVLYKRITGESVVLTCCFLAAVFVWKLIFPLKKINRYFAWQVFSIVMIGLFSWWLIYTAENTRAGWYRFNVLQRRIQSLVAHAPAYVVLADSDGQITAVSDNIQLLTGYTPKEIIGQNTTVLMRDAPAAKHLVAYDKAIHTLRRKDAPDSGWTLQGAITVGIKHKNGSIVPVKAYAGGIRWSTDIQFNGDIDIFAVFVPVSQSQAIREIKEGDGTTLKKDTEIKAAAPPPPVQPLAPLPSPKPLPPPQNQPVGNG